VDYRIADDGRYEVMLDGLWYRVPNRFVLRNEGNPVGKAVACYTTIVGYGSLSGNGSYDGDRIEIRKREPISVLDVCGSWLRRSSVATEFVDGH
jgi:hypothetical protein